MVVSAKVGASLVTYSLGSCIGVAIYDPVVKVGGLLHFMLPESSIDKDKAAKNPYMFADTGIPAFFKAAYALGLKKSRVKVAVAGGGMILDDSGRFNIGKRNYTTLRNLFWKNNVLIDAEDVGGSDSRTVYLDMATGTVKVRYGNRTEKLLLNGSQG
jgi:chemotaxis protein CheD